MGTIQISGGVYNRNGVFKIYLKKISCISKYLFFKLFKNVLIEFIHLQVSKDIKIQPRIHCISKLYFILKI